MPAVVIRVEVPDVYGQRERARAAAEGIARMIGDQPKGWEVSVSETVDQPTTTEARQDVRQFRLNPKPYLPRE